MRSVGILAACTIAMLGMLPAVVHAQSTTTPTTTRNEAASIWEKIKGSWAQTKGSG